LQFAGYNRKSLNSEKEGKMSKTKERILWYGGAIVVIVLALVLSNLLMAQGQSLPDYGILYSDPTFHQKTGDDHWQETGILYSGTVTAHSFLDVSFNLELNQDEPLSSDVSFTVLIDGEEFAAWELYEIMIEESEVVNLEEYQGQIEWTIKLPPPKQGIPVNVVLEYEVDIQSQWMYAAPWFKTKRFLIKGR
jgi:hypothetical protein